MSFPFFPLQVDALHAELEFHDFHAGDVINPRPGVTLRTAALNHPGGAIGYRIEYGGQSVAYVTDIELGDGPLDPALLALTKDAALVILDTTYTDEELPSHAGWGHSSWQQGIRLANAAGAGRLCLFHHDPEHDDAFMDKIRRAAEAARPGTIVASEGLQIEVCRSARRAQLDAFAAARTPSSFALFSASVVLRAARCSASGARWSGAGSSSRTPDSGSRARAAGRR